MKTKHRENRVPSSLKKKLSAALAMLLISSVLMITATYAWLVLSVAPEVTGITTNIGANGSLEIALLNSNTRKDLTSIRTGIGNSMATATKTVANLTWGNLIDLGDASYGLSNILLLPARLQTTKSGDNYRVSDGLLAIPTYGYDGRVVELDEGTITTVYNNGSFSFEAGNQSYGVRAIGTTSALNSMSATLAMARSNVLTYSASANSTAATAFSSNGSALFNIVATHAMTPAGTFGESDLNAIKSLLGGLETSLNYIELALRQAILGYAATNIHDIDEFTLAKTYITSSSNSLSTIITEKADLIPAVFATYATTLSNMQNNLRVAQNSCNALSGGSYTWEDLSPAMTQIMNSDYVFLNDTKVSTLNSSIVSSLTGKEVILTLGPGSGVPADIANFVGDYKASVAFAGISTQITTETTVSPVYLTAIYQAMQSLVADDSAVSGSFALESTFGYALDLAFRTNATAADLRLQTSPMQRVYADSTATATQGSGSFMEFSTSDPDFTIGSMIDLMDAIRVGFVDDANTLLAVAKLNTSNRSVENHVVKAPLYLYEWSIDAEGIMVMGERQKTNSKLTDLDQNVAKAITVIVWLDGDIVDNTMVSAKTSMSLSGTLNLQFSTSADLVPASNGELYAMDTEKTTLDQLIVANTDLQEAGQALYTTASWMAYESAYEYAQAVQSSLEATPTQVGTAVRNLREAQSALQLVSHEALQSKIAEVRTLTGTTTEESFWAYYDADTKDFLYCDLSASTQEMLDQFNGKAKTVIHTVDYTNNIHDEGNGIKTSIYTEESWNRLAKALYYAEALDINSSATDKELDSAITALDAAFKAIERSVYYIACDLNDQIYYFAISEETDTYGKWYDSNFKRVVADKTILDLDARATLAKVATIDLNPYIQNNPGLLTPSVTLNTDTYAVLAGDEIVGAEWTVPESYFDIGVSAGQKAILDALIEEAEELELPADHAALVAAKALTYEDGKLTSSVRPVKLITDLNEALKPLRDVETPDPADMTADQKTLLNAALKLAKDHTGYEDAAAYDPSGSAEAPSQEMLDLVDAVKEAEIFLEGVTTNAGATAQLAALNAALVAVGEHEITEYNTLVVKAPSVSIGSDSYEIVNCVDAPQTALYLNDKTGTTEVSAVIITKKGVVYTATTEVTIYRKAEDAELQDPSTHAKLTGLAGTVNQSRNDFVSVVLVYAEELGTDVGEHIKTCSWASANTNVLKVTGGETDTAPTLTMVSAGTTILSVSVTTEEGNVYTAFISVTVSE